MEDEHSNNDVSTQADFAQLVIQNQGIPNEELNQAIEALHNQEILNIIDLGLRDNCSSHIASRHDELSNFTQKSVGNVAINLSNFTHSNTDQEIDSFVLNAKFSMLEQKSDAGESERSKQKNKINNAKNERSKSL